MQQRLSPLSIELDLMPVEKPSMLPTFEKLEDRIAGWEAARCLANKRLVGKTSAQDITVGALWFSNRNMNTGYQYYDNY
eukprot:11226876-Lingulodinium_polyedra.AAC.1